MSDERAEQTLTIDPVKEGIVNRIAAGTVQRGNLVCEGGLWVEGTVVGDLVVNGVLVLSSTGVLQGRVCVNGPRAALVGTIEPGAGEQELAEVEVHGVVQLGATLNAKANITAARFEFFEGAQVEGRIRTFKQAKREAEPAAAAAA